MKKNQNLFGTDGVRCTVGTEPFTHNTLPIFTQALAQWMAQRYPNPRILIAQDTRASGDWISAHIQSALLAHGCTIFDAHILPTPGVAALLHHTNQFDCGIIISASHNPHQDNGIKIIDARNGKLSSNDELAIESLYTHNAKPLNGYDQFGHKLVHNNASLDYKTIVANHFPQNFLHGLTIALDCAHGATFMCAPQLFTQLGAHVITLNAQPNGTNINNQCGALHPQQLQKAVVKHSTDIGFAFDGDGDRVIAVDKNGTIKDGDDILSILSTHPTYQNQDTIVGTIMSNQGFASHLQHHNKTLLRTPVGDKYVGAALQKNNLLLGGEQSGHIIMHDYLPSGDGIFTALRIVQTIITTGNWNFTTFTRYPQHLVNVAVKEKKPLSDKPYAQLINQYESLLKNGRLVVRYSGTERLLRVMVEDEQKEFAQKVGNELAQKLSGYLN